MTQNLEIKGTEYTPQIQFNSLTGQMEITGRAIPQCADNFWSRVLLWFDEYAQSPAIQTTLKVNLEYFHVTSTKRIFQLVAALNEMQANGYLVAVEWFYEEYDFDMIEIGDDFKAMVAIPFELKQVMNELLVA